jgi:hypothetical protein
MNEKDWPLLYQLAVHLPPFLVKAAASETPFTDLLYEPIEHPIPHYHLRTRVLKLRVEDQYVQGVYNRHIVDRALLYPLGPKAALVTTSENAVLPGLSIRLTSNTLHAITRDRGHPTKLWLPEGPEAGLPGIPGVSWYPEYGVATFQVLGLMVVLFAARFLPGQEHKLNPAILSFYPEFHAKNAFVEHPPGWLALVRTSTNEVLTRSDLAENPAWTWDMPKTPLPTQPEELLRYLEVRVSRTVKQSSKGLFAHRSLTL